MVKRISTVERLAALETKAELAQADRTEMKESLQSIRKDLTSLISAASRLEAVLLTHLKTNRGPENQLIERGIAAGSGGGAMVGLLALGKVLNWW